jgi:hypothetical protein
VRHDAIVEPNPGPRLPADSDEPTVDESGGRPRSRSGREAVLDPVGPRIATFDISFAVTTLVVVCTAIAAVLTSHGVAAAAWIEALGASASACCGAYLAGALGAGDGPEERRRAAGWVAFAALALGGLLVLEFLREFFTAG